MQVSCRDDVSFARGSLKRESPSQIRGHHDKQGEHENSPLTIKGSIVSRLLDEASAHHCATSSISLSTISSRIILITSIMCP